MGNSPLYPGIPSGAAGGVLAGSFPNPSGLQPVGGKISLGSNAGGNIKLATDDAPPSPGFPSTFFAYAGSGGDADATYSAQFGPSFHIRGGDGGDGSQEYPNAGAGGHVYVNGGFSGSAYPGGYNAHAGNVFIGTDSSRTSGTEIGNADAVTLLRGSVITIAGRSAEAAEILQSRPGDATRTDLRIRPADGPTSTEAYGVYGGYFFLEGGTGGAGDGSYPGQKGGNVGVYGGAGGADGGLGQGPGGSVYLKGGSGSTGGNVTIDGGDGTNDGNISIGATRAKSILIGNSTVGSRIGFFGVPTQLRQTGGAATAGGAYTATEQTMIQKAYDCLRSFGLLD